MCYKPASTNDVLLESTPQSVLKAPQSFLSTQWVFQDGGLKLYMRYGRGARDLHRGHVDLYMYIHTHTHIHMHIHICISIHTHISYMCKCISVISVCVYIYIHHTYQEQSRPERTPRYTMVALKRRRTERPEEAFVWTLPILHPPPLMYLEQLS